MSNAVIDAIMNRRSVRAYTDQPLNDEQIKILLDAALAAPSGMNAQPWHVTVLKDKNVMEDIRNRCADYFKNNGNPEFEKRMRESSGLFYNAPVAFFISTPRKNPSPLDCGIMVENIAIAAMGLGMGSVVLGIPNLAFTTESDAELCAKLKYPEDYCHSIAIAVGYVADTGAPHALPDGKISYVG